MRKLPLMKRSIFVAVVSLALLVTAAAQKASVPTFNQFPARVEKVSARSIDLKKSDGAWTFRTRLTEALRGGVNFAGRYIVTGWGCGTGCISGAIIDARTGRVYFPEQLGGMGTGTTDDGEYVDEPVRYRKNSRMLVISGVPATHTEGRDELPMGDYYYEWKNNGLRLIRSVVHKKN
jgi:hypothetical protein